jgi:hypothetical protein
MIQVIDTRPQVLAQLPKLPPDKQRELFEFAEFLVQRHRPKQPRQSIKGLCADLGVQITDEDIAQARQELWGQFPKELF